MNTLEYVAYLKTVKAKVFELNSLLNNEFGYKLNEVLQNYESLFKRFCPYKVGDLVQLKDDLAIAQNSGWYSSKHFLVKSGAATVKTCGDYQNDLFCFGLEFDDESYIDMHGEVKPVIAKHLYYLSENLIEGA